MLAKKQTVLFFLFIGICVSLVLISIIGQWDGGVFKDIDTSGEQVSSMQESYFKKARYHLLKDDIPSFNLTSDELTLNSTSKQIFFLKPRGFAFTQSNERVDYEGDHGFFNQRDEILVLEQNSAVKMTETSAKAKKLTYLLKKDEVHLEGDVKTKTFHAKEEDWIYVDSDEAYFWPEAQRSRYLGNVEGEIDRKRVYEDSLSFGSRELLLNMVTLKADLNEDVIMKKRYLTATSRRGEIFLENYNKKLKYFALYDDVKVVEKVMLDGKFIDRKAFSEKLEGLPSENKIILTGYPKVYQLNDVIKGNKIVLRENTEVVEVDDANTKFKVE